MNRCRDDEGLTLIEVVVSLTVMAVFMAMFTTSILQMYRSANSSEATVLAQSQVNLAFLKLDKQIRYAAGISQPGTGSSTSDPYVEYLTTDGTTATCHQMRLDSSTLWWRSWTDASGTSPGSTWTPLVSGVSGSTPFVYTAPTDSAAFQRLEVTLTASSGAGSTARSKKTDITFTALNTNRGSTALTDCAVGRT